MRTNSYIRVGTKDTIMLQLPLFEEIKGFFPYHRKELVKNCMLLAQCIERSRTVCLYKARCEAGAAVARKDLNKDNVYKTFLRFFNMKCQDAFCIGLIYLIINLLDLRECVYIVMDRTNWKIGKTNINILYIGLLLPNGSFIPILFDLLDKRGNSNTQERTSILDRFCVLWAQQGLQKAIVLADREFVGTEWFSAVLQAGFSLVIRLRVTDYFNDLCVQRNRSADRMNHIIAYSVKRYGFFRSKIILNGQTLYYIVLPFTATTQRRTGEKYLILIADNPNVPVVGAHYQRRWKIEVFFLNMKTNGFNLEDLNLKQPQKVQLMLAILALLYVLIQKEHLIHNKQIKTKKFKSGTAKAISIFRNSYDDFKLKVLTINDLWQFIMDNFTPKIQIPKPAFNACKHLNLKSGG